VLKYIFKERGKMENKINDLKRLLREKRATENITGKNYVIEKNWLGLLAVVPMNPNKINNIGNAAII
jgi:hypothetical protein